MPRKYPLCALCGESIVGKAYALHEFRGLPGKPMIAWHLSACREKDILAKRFEHDFKGVKIEKVTQLWRIDKIDERGAGRVVRNKLYEKEQLK